MPARRTQTDARGGRALRLTVPLTRTTASLCRAGYRAKARLNGDQESVWLATAAFARRNQDFRRLYIARTVAHAQSSWGNSPHATFLMKAITNFCVPRIPILIPCVGKIVEFVRVRLDLRICTFSFCVCFALPIQAVILF